MKIRRLIRAFYPARCAVCDEVIAYDRMLCPVHERTLRPFAGDTCRKCGKPLRDTERLCCYDCSRKLHFFDRGFAVFKYEDVRVGLYRFKYSGRAEYARFYAFAAHKVYGKTIREIGPDAIVPVPIHRKRMLVRGYNQAGLIAHELSGLTGIPVREDLVRRSKATLPLKNLSEDERKNNLKKAFIIASNDVKLKKILLVDDIYTTGSTIDAISVLLRSTGVSEIYFLAVAIGAGL